MNYSSELVKEFLLKNMEVTAMFSTSFDLTLGVIKAVNELGINIPDDVSLMVFDSMFIYEALSPELWTII